MLGDGLNTNRLEIKRKHSVGADKRIKAAKYVIRVTQDDIDKAIEALSDHRCALA